MGWLEERTTHHCSKGKFCHAGSAATVTKDGERYKVVRQHRKMGGPKKKKMRESVLKAVSAAHERSDASRVRARMRGWVPVREVICGG